MKLEFIEKFSNAGFIRIVFFISLLFFRPNLNAQSNSYIIDRFESEFTLSNSNINCMIQDSFGFIWIGTDRGLNRFDGLRNEVFLNKKDNVHSLSNNVIKILALDSQANILWIGTRDGLNKFDFQTEIFERVSFQTEKKLEITCIVKDNNNLWLGTSDGLFIFDLVNLKLKPISTNYPIFDKQIGMDIRCILKDDSLSCLWFGCSNGLYQIKQNGLLMKYIYSNERNNLVSNSIQALCRIPSSLLIGTDKGLQKLNLNGSEMIQNIYLEGGIEKKWINCLAVENKKNIWVGTRKGVEIVQLSGKESIKSSENSNVLGNQQIQSVLIGRNGMVIVGTYKAGLYYHYQQKIRFHGNLVDKKVFGILKDSQKNMWFGTWENGLIKTDGKQNILKNYNQGGGYLSSNMVNTICEGNHGDIWVGAWEFGLSCLKNYGNGPVIHYGHQPRTPNTISGWTFRSIIKDRRNRIWFASWDGGLTCFDEKANTYKQFDSVKTQNGNKISLTKIWSLYEDLKENKIWIATEENALLLMNYETELFYQYDLNNPKNKERSSPAMSCFLQDTIRNILYIGTFFDGILVFDCALNRFKKPLLPNSYEVSTITGLLMDNYNVMWASTENGILVINPNDLKSIKIFNKNDGLQSNEFNIGAVYKDNEGVLYFGGINGYNYIEPSAFSISKNRPHISFSKLRISGELIKPKMKYKGRILLSKDLKYTSSINLEYYDKNISIEIIAPYYISPQKCKFRYRLSGLDDKWFYSEITKPEINYSNLLPGKYQLIIQIMNEDGVLNSEEAKLTMVVSPPWWKTWIFRIFLVLSISIAIYSSIFYRIRSLKQQKAKLEREVTLRTVHLNMAKDKLLTQKDELLNKNELLNKQAIEIQEYAQKLHEADDLKMKFFTNITHEFRTPLTIIQGMADKISNIANGSEINHVSKMLKINVGRLLKLVNQLLDFRRMDQQAYPLKVIKNDLAGFINEIVFSFEPLSLKHRIKLNFEAPTHGLECWFDHDIIEKVMYNLISNAIKFTPDNGKVSIKLSIEKQNAEIEISDTGAGIPIDELEKIFDRFYQADNTVLHPVESSGLGLALVKDLIEVHRGKITAFSKENIGSTFKIIIPINIESYSDCISNVPKYNGIQKEIYEIQEEDSDIPSFLLQENNNENAIILLVEDNSELRTYIYSELIPYFQIHLANHGKEGLEKSFEIIPDLIISDIMMPEMNGLEMSAILKNDIRTSHIPLILLTAKSEEFQQIEGLKTGADDYITKPFSMSVLLLKIQNIISARKKLIERYSNQLMPNITLLSNNDIDKVFLSKILKIVEENISNSEFDSDQLSAKIGMSKSHFYKKVKALTGESVNILIRNIRLQHAASLLKSGKVNISELAYAVGFTDPAYFTRCFTNLFNMPPSKYS